MFRFVALTILSLTVTSLSASTPIQSLQQKIAQQNYASAIEQGRLLLKQNPHHAWLRFLTAYAYQLNQQPEQAIPLYQSVIRDNPELPEPRNNLAIIYLEQGDYDRASQLLVDAINTHPSYATAYENLSRIYTGLASEAYRRAISESAEPANYTHNIDLAALDSLDMTPQTITTPGQAAEQTLVTTANLETLLSQKVQDWATAWSNKDFNRYSGHYSPQYRGKFNSHGEWLEYRRQRVTRPGDIQVEVSQLKIRWTGENRAIIDFRQRFDSPRYSDRVIKRLAFSRLGAEWKITEERVLSVL
ncbi:MAG: tetratricopeptide repeat protein [Pseudomonadota bacterium]